MGSFLQRDPDSSNRLGPARDDYQWGLCRRSPQAVGVRVGYAGKSRKGGGGASAPRRGSECGGSLGRGPVTGSAAADGCCS
jgi:hypothetical protein